MEKKALVSRTVRYVLYAVLLLVVLYLFLRGNFSVQEILAFTPEDPLKAAAVLLALYAIKSATVFFPMILLEIAAGHLFSPWPALGINLLGILVVLTIPYWIGRTAGVETIQKLMERYPRFRGILDRQQNSSFFLCFFLRVISCLPGDIVSMYFGATKTPFGKYLVAGSLGILPGMILATLMGSSIQNPESPAFWISAILVVSLSVFSVLLYYLYRRKRIDI